MVTIYVGGKRNVRYFFGTARTVGVNELLWRLVVIAAVITVATYGIYLFFAGMISAESSEGPRIVAIDQVSPGEHDLSGVVVVPSVCHGLSVNTRKISVSEYHLFFQTWQEPTRICPDEPDTKPFRTTVYAPSVGVTFTATLDGEPIALQVIRYYR
jgi:hypothetical protein